VRASVVIPSREGGALLERHLPEVVAQAGALPGGCEVVVSDDGTRGAEDRTREIVAANAPTALLVHRDEAMGFSGACDRGADAARGRTLLFLNNDMHPEAGCFATLISALEADDTLFAVTPVIENAAEGFFESTTRMRWVHGVFDPYFPGRDGRAPPAPGELRPIGFACGAALACGADRYHALGGFSETYAPFYWEDTDLGWRARRHGWEIAEIGDARMRHEHSQTIGAFFTKAEAKRIYERNRWLFTWTHLAGKRAWLGHAAWTLLRVLAGLARGEPQGAAFFDALARRHLVRAARNTLSGTRRTAIALHAEVARSGVDGWPSPAGDPPASGTSRNAADGSLAG
jgi:GT2 family glycosyltransferase